MIDLAAIKARIAAMPNADDQTVVTRRGLEQIVEALTAAQAAEKSAVPFELQGCTL